ncbi:hypothetical protein ACK8GG_06435 [Micromonosporaceae bacterium DT55]|uniref:hypothetical protein n=1 Tax=Melissospora conviva TaxID=3388432 RepID=UPI003C1E134A
MSTPSGTSHPDDPSARPAAAAADAAADAGRRPGRRVQILLSLLAVAAGVIAIAAAFLPWMTVTAFGSTVVLTGLDGTEGWLVITLGLVLAGYGAVNVAGRDHHLGMSVLSGLLALVLVAVGVQQIRGIGQSRPGLQSTVDSIAQQNSLLGFDGAVDTSVQLAVGVGLWLVVAAGLLGTVAAALILFLRHRGNRQARATA